MSKRLTPFQFKMAANTHLEGINLRELLTNVNLQTDESGFILDRVLENIKTTLRVAARMTPEDLVKSKCQKFLDFLNNTT